MKKYLILIIFMLICQEACGTAMIRRGSMIERAGGGQVAIGGAVTDGTEGSSLFVGAAGVLAQDNASLFFDDTNNQFKISTGVAAGTEGLRVTNATDNASVATTVLQGDRATITDGDTAYLSLRLSDSAGNQDEQARISWQATTVASGATQDGDLILSALVNNSLTEMLRLDGSAASNRIWIGAEDIYGGVYLEKISGLGLRIYTGGGAASMEIGPLTIVAEVDSTGYLNSNGNQMLTWTNATGAVSVDINAAGGNFDTQIRGDTVAALLYVDASTDRIGINNAAPGYTVEGISDNVGVMMSGTSGVFVPVFISQNAVTGVPPGQVFAAARSSSAALASGDIVGYTSYSGHDGTDYNLSARIQAEVDGAVSGNTVPMRLLFKTSATQSSGMTEALRINSLQSTIASGRVQIKQGADVASATNLALGFDGNVFELTGTTKVDLIVNTGWQNGSVITLIANENVTIDDGTATSGANITIVLAGGADFAMTADDVLTLMLSETTAGGVAWREVSRSVN